MRKYTHTLLNIYTKCRLISFVATESRRPSLLYGTSHKFITKRRVEHRCYFQKVSINSRRIKSIRSHSILHKNVVLHFHRLERNKFTKVKPIDLPLHTKHIILLEYKVSNRFGWESIILFPDSTRSNSKKFSLKIVCYTCIRNFNAKMSEKKMDLKRFSENAINDSIQAKISKSARSASPNPSNDLCASPVPVLNDDCLLHIFSYLSNEDLCPVGDSCPRFAALAEEAFRAKNRQKKFCVRSRPYAEWENLTKQEAKVIKDFGYLIEYLTLDWGQYIYSDDILCYNPNSDTSIWTLVYKKCPMLKELEMTGPTPWKLFDVLDADFPCRGRFEHLTTLKIGHMWKCDEKFMSIIEKHFKNVENLSFSAEQFAEIFEKPISLPTLRKLSIDVTNWDKYKGEMHLLKSLTATDQLESLALDMDYKIGDTYNWQVLYKFINLKSLSINHRFAKIGVDFFEDLSRNLNQLERLDLTHYLHETPHHTDPEKLILCIVERFALLKSLTMTDLFWCYLLREATFLKIVSLRKKSNVAFPLDIWLTNYEKSWVYDVNHAKICSEVQERYKPYVRLHYMVHN